MPHVHSDTTKALLLCTRSAWVVSIILVFIMFVADFENPTNDTTSVSATCFAVAGVLTIMPWQLAPLVADRGTEVFKDLVLSGARMCSGSLLFLVATILKLGLVKYTSSNNPKDPLATALLVGSGVLFVFAAWLTCVGFFQFTEFITHLCCCPDEPDVIEEAK